MTSSQDDDGQPFLRQILHHRFSSRRYFRFVNRQLPALNQLRVTMSFSVLERKDSCIEMRLKQKSARQSHGKKQFAPVTLFLGVEPSQLRELVDRANDLDALGDAGCIAGNALAVDPRLP